MSSAPNEPHGDPYEVEDKAAVAQVDHAADLDEKAQVSDYKADAIAAENAEHDMTVMEAVRAYPMASFWAFVMSFTIVLSSLPIYPGGLVPTTRNRN
jgi:SP family general alpha glucoside:H+ symporter-like MFS transporter